MLYVDTPTHDDIVSLAETRADGAVSIYVPTTPLTQDIGAAQIAFGNLVKTAMEQLAVAGFDKRRAALLDDAFAALQHDDDFWRLQAHSLAVFATPDRIVSYRLANKLQATAQVSDRFHLKPLLRAVTFPHEAFVLAVSENKVRILHVTGDAPPSEIKLSDLPRDAASHAGKASLNDRGASGRIQGSEGQRIRHLQYLRAIDAAIRPLLAGRKTPLILAAVDPLAHLYPSVNTYRHLLEATIAISPDDASDADIAARVTPLLDAAHAAELAQLRDQYEARTNQGRTATDITDVARAATYGAVEVLFADIDSVVPGTIDDAGVVTLADKESAATYGVIDEIAARALMTGARILAVRADDVPGSAGVAAILRYPV